MTEGASAAPAASAVGLELLRPWIPPAVIDDGPAVVLYAFVVTAGVVILFVVLCVASWRLWTNILRRLVGSWPAGLAVVAVIIGLAYLQASGRVEFQSLYRDGLAVLDAGPAEFVAGVVAVVLGALAVTAGLAAIWWLGRAVGRWAAVIVTK